MNLNLNLNTDLARLAKPLQQRLGLIITLCLVALLGYTAYFVSNLFFAQDDLDALSRRQDSAQTKVIKINEATLESLVKLIPSQAQPAQNSSGRSNPFAPI